MTQTSKAKKLIVQTTCLFILLACRPMLVIGWEEILILALVIGFLIGPPIYNFLRKVEISRRQKDK